MDCDRPAFGVEWGIMMLESDQNPGQRPYDKEEPATTPTTLGGFTIDERISAVGEILALKGDHLSYEVRQMMASYPDADDPRRATIDTLCADIGGKEDIDPQLKLAALSAIYGAWDLEKVIAPDDVKKRFRLLRLKATEPALGLAAQLIMADKGGINYAWLARYRLKLCEECPEIGADAAMEAITKHLAKEGRLCEKENLVYGTGVLSAIIGDMNLPADPNDALGLWARQRLAEVSLDQKEYSRALRLSSSVSEALGAISDPAPQIENPTRTAIVEKRLAALDIFDKAATALRKEEVALSKKAKFVRSLDTGESGWYALDV